MKKKTSLALAAAALAVSASGSLAASEQTASSGKITVHSTEVLKAEDVTDGGVAGTGRFTISGAIGDKGTVTDYRTVKGARAIIIRRVAAGKKGTITFAITINLTAGSAPWTIASGTRAYKGLRGKGTEVVDNYEAHPATFVLKGTVWQ